MQYAAEPDRIRELHAAADSLQDIPREFCETKQDMIFFNRRIARQIRSIAEHIEIKEPVKTARTVATRTPRAPRRRDGEVQLALCL